MIVKRRVHKSRQVLCEISNSMRRQERGLRPVSGEKRPRRDLPLLRNQDRYRSQP